MKLGWLEELGVHCFGRVDDEAFLRLVDDAMFPALRVFARTERG